MELAHLSNKDEAPVQARTLDKEFALPEFIFMLTKNDVTVPNARELVSEVMDPRLRIIGFKDIGLDLCALAELTSLIRAQGRKVAMEVVSLDESAELRSAALAVQLEVDYLLGGSRADLVTKLLKDSAIEYYPFPQAAVGHPSRLCGTIDGIVESGQRLMEKPGVTGLDLLAYRFSGEAELLLRTFVAEVNGPVIAAGSIDRPERIEAVKAAGAWAFTVGSAAFERRFDPASGNLGAQIQAILTALEGEAQGRN